MYVSCFAAGDEGCARSGQRRSCYDHSCCWRCALVARRRSQLRPPPGAGAQCASAPGTRPRGFPDESPLLMPLANGGLARWNTVLVGASPVVDYFAFMLENLAILHSSCLREIRQVSVVPRPVDLLQMRSMSL